MKSGSTEEKVEKADNLYTVKTSNAGIIAVDSDGTLTAVAPGTAKVTISYGKTTKEVTVTVSNE